MPLGGAGPEALEVHADAARQMQNEQDIMVSIYLNWHILWTYALHSCKLNHALIMQIVYSLKNGHAEAVEVPTNSAERRENEQDMQVSIYQHSNKCNSNHELLITFNSINKGHPALGINPSPTASNNIDIHVEVLAILFSFYIFMISFTSLHSSVISFLFFHV